MFHIITGAIMGFVAIYIFARCFAPLNIPLVFKLLAGLVLFTAAFKLQILRFFVGSLSNSIVPVWILASSGWVFSVVIVLALLLLTRDLGFLLHFAARGFTPSSGTPLLSTGQWTALLVGLAMLISGFGVWQALRVPPVRKVELALPDLPAKLDGLRIVQLSDLHIGSIYDGKWLTGVVDRANELKPDIIAITGDFVDGDVKRLASEVAPLAKLKARDGVFACVGNHEYYSGYIPWTKALRKLGLTLLLNEHAVIKHGDTPIVVAGVTDPVAIVVAGVNDNVALPSSLPGPDIDAALAGSPDGVFRLLLDHRPSGVEKNAARGVNLQLSGHTHGGQLWPLNLAVSSFNGGFLSGIYHVGKMTLYISPGSGLWGGFPVRIGVPSEITELILRKK